MKKIKRVIIACLLPVVFAACSHVPQRKEPARAELANNFSQRIAELKEITAGKGDDKIRARAHKDLALLYYQSENPDVDYEKALKEVEMYIALRPEKAYTSETRDMLGVLRELESYRVKIGELTETIDMLQSLDVELEKQRELMK